MPRFAALLATVALLPACTGLFFYPFAQHVRTPEHIGLSYEDVFFETADGVRLHGWFLPAKGDACATVLFLHGNAENISTHIASVYWLPSRGFNVFMPDYRGYGASAGSPSLPGLQADVDAAMQYLLTHRRTDEPIVLFGQSLGAATAIYYTAHSRYRERIRALVAESAFTSHRDIAREKLAALWLTWPLQWVPLLTVSDAYSPLSAVAKVHPIPILLIHGEQDVIIPPVHSARLFAAAREPKELWRADGAGHIEALRSPGMRDRFVSYLSRHTCGRGQEAFSSR